MTDSTHMQGKTEGSGIVGGKPENSSEAEGNEASSLLATSQRGTVSQQPREGDGKGGNDGRGEQGRGGGGGGQKGDDNQNMDPEMRNRTGGNVEEGRRGGGGRGEEDGTGREDEEDDEVEIVSPKMCCFCPKWEFTFREYLEEVKLLVKLAWPNVVYMLLEAMMTIMAVLFSGHLGKNELAAASLANSITTVFTRSIGLGFASSCDTLFTQFYGSPKKGQIGIVLQRGFLIMCLLCFACWGILINAETILLLAHQSPEVARMAGVYCLIYIPAVPGDYYSMLLIKWLQSQSRLMPVVITTAITNVISVGLYYVLIYPLGLRLVGAAIAQVMSHYLLGILITAYIVWKKLYKETWTSWSRDCMDDWMPIFKLGMAGCFMVCLEWWSFDVGFYLAGLLGEESIGAHAIIMYTATTGEMFPYGIGIAAAIRVGNSLGARKPGIAHLASVASLSLGVLAAIILAIFYIGLKDVIPYLFTSDKNTIAIASSILPICAMFAVLDATATVCGGVIRGTGRQAVGATINILGYYFIGLPLGISLMFPLGKGIHGFWSGMTLGLFIQALFLVAYTLRLNWSKETRNAQKRIGSDDTDVKRISVKKIHYVESPPVNGDPVKHDKALDALELDAITRNDGLSCTPDSNTALNSALSAERTRANSQSFHSEEEDSDSCDGIRPVTTNGYVPVSSNGANFDANHSSNNNSAGSVPNAATTKAAMALEDLPIRSPFWRLVRLRLFFLLLGLLYVGLAILCRVLVVPPLRTIAAERQLLLANMTNVANVTEAVSYNEL